MLKPRQSEIIHLEELGDYLEGAPEDDPLRIVHEIFNCNDVEVEKDDEEAERVIQEEKEQLERLRRESKPTDEDLRLRIGPTKGKCWDDRFI